ncbi:MAG TPA: sporulation protein YunB [Pseudoneobacillus sp.]|nr:sporulation protein YunB [Pseudoneobacillus sp.]
MAKFRGPLSRRGPLPFRYVFLLTFVFFTFSTASGLWVIDKGIEPTLMAYAETQTKKIATLVISKAINKRIVNGMNINDIIETTNTAENGPMVKLNTEIINRVMSETQTLIHMNIKEAEKGNLESLEYITDVEIDMEESKKSKGIVYEVPLGQATNNALLGNLGPKIPVRFNAVGEVEVNPRTELKPFGINNAWIAVYIEVKVDVQIIVPFATKVTTVTQDIPVAMGTIPGKVPQFYNGAGGDGSGPSIELPLD